LQDDLPFTVSIEFETSASNPALENLRLSTDAAFAAAADVKRDLMKPLTVTPGSTVSTTSSLPACPFGASCYRKNPDHLAAYSHPPRIAPASKKKVHEDIVSGDDGDNVEPSSGKRTRLDPAATPATAPAAAPTPVVAALATAKTANAVTDLATATSRHAKQRS
jgi:hypothetical protein